jgi:hypothetical protein
MANAGHCHRDQGSFILEAGGESFAIDRGAVPYEDAANLPFMRSEVAHNLAVPSGCTQQSPSLQASGWLAQGEGTTLTATIDTGAAWQAPVVSCRRTINSPTPDCFEIIDEIELAEPRTVTFFLHSPLPMDTGNALARIRGARFTLEVTADWAVTAVAKRCGVNWCYTPIRQLALGSAPARQHRLVTVLRLKRRKKGRLIRA